MTDATREAAQEEGAAEGVIEVLRTFDGPVNDNLAAIQQLEAAEAQLRAATLALEAAQQRYTVGAATLVEVTQARAAQTQAASALVSARYGLLFQRTAIGYFVGDLNPRAVSIG